MLKTTDLFTSQKEKKSVTIVAVTGVDGDLPSLLS